MNGLAKVNDIENPDIAVIGISGRFPGAQNLDQFWQNLRSGVESVSFFCDQELESAGIDPTVLSDPNYVKARPILENIDLFDASFFDINPREAEIMDPQHRIFLECASEALESAGYNSERYSGAIAVYAGSAINQYLLNLYSNRDIIELVDATQINIGNFNDYLPTRVSYKLNLKGPSYAVQSSCSTSLVAVHVACQSLLNHECDMALAGGITITNQLPKVGYRYEKEGILSPDGHCRAFDAKAQGTLFGSGVGIVVLKRLKDALADGDCIHALIKGSAINNDGSLKAGFTAPSVDSQAEVIVEALGAAGVKADTITYVEAHGTATPIGDPIEMKALTKAFRTSTRKQDFCAIGSVKTNIGHLDAAAGIAGLIKTILALKHKQIPPSLHFTEPNPQIDFANSPFYVNTTLSEWKTGMFPRRAGVTSLGFGGTNAHVILEEAPTTEFLTWGAREQAREYQLLVLSAKTASALESATANLVKHLQQHLDLNLADVAYTLQVGRRDFDHRRMLVCQNIDDAVKALETQESQRVFTQFQSACSRPVVFMFSGQGAQYVNMGRDLYQTESKFRELVDRCCEKLKPYLGLDLRSVLYPSEAQAEAAAEQLKQTYITQSALFVVEYALAQLWISWGVRPSAMIGHSIGEYVAACLAGVFSLQEALVLVATRGQLMQKLPPGAMLAIPLEEKQVQSLLDEKLSLAAINAPSLCVVSGQRSAINDLHNSLTEQGVECRFLHTSHAFHSDMMEPIVDPFMAQVRKVNFKAPQIPFVSNVTGTWITAAEATDPSYWARHLRQTVRFCEGIGQLLQKPEQILLEVGPGQTLSTLSRQHSHKAAQQVILSSLRHPKEQHSDVAFILNTLGKLWLVTAEIDWSGFYASQRRQRIPLPTYPFERQRYWIERQTPVAPVTTQQKPLHKKPNIADWFYVPSWKKSIQLEPSENGNLAEQNFCWLVFVDECGLGELLVKHLQEQKQDMIAVMVGDKFIKLSDRTYCINPQQRDDYDALLQALIDRDLTPQIIAHLWGITANNQTPSEIESFETNQYFGFYSLLFLAQALGQQGITDPLQILVVTNNIYDVTGDESLCPEKATVIGSCKVIPQEYPNIICRSIDVVLPQLERQKQKLIDQLIGEVTIEPTDLVIAYRGHHRWVQTFEAVRLEKAISGKTRLRQKGVYLITGGLGGIGLGLAEYLAQTVQAKLVLVGRSGLPEKDEWEQWLATHDDQDSVSIKIKKVQALEELGASILVKSADITDFKQMQVLKTQVTERFGEIHGIIHAAGIAGGGIIQLKTPQAAASVMASKVKGTLVLDAIFRDVKLDFLVICSSDSSILGELGQVDYCAANVFLDCFAHRNFFKQGSFTVSINWCGWRDMGMLVNTAVPEDLKKRREEKIKEGIATKEGVDAFSRIIYSGLPQVVVSTRDFQTRIEQNYSKISLEEQLADLEEQLALSSFSKPTYPRPNLGNDYVAPRTRVEQSVANIWQQLLGIEQIGIHDNFFELGGHSLLATQVISQLRKSFPIELPLRSIFFEHSTIAKLAELIEQMIMEKIEQLSEEEAQRLLGV